MATTTPSKQQRSNKQQQQQNQAPMARRVAATLNRLEKKDPGLREFLKKAYGYAVFPAVGKASLVVGGAHGHGGVFERGKFIGHATLSQITLGVQLGGDTFTEILAFHDKGSLDRFKNGHMTFTASASAVLVKAGAAATSNFKGVTAHAYSSGGMLLELAIGGQKFTFKPLGDEQSGRSVGGGKGQSQRGGENEAAEGDGEDEQDEGGRLGQMLSNARSAVDGVRGAASKVGDLAREHPVAATLIGAGLTTGLAFLLVRATRQAQGGSASDEDQGDEQEDDDQDSDARGESDDYEDDEGGDGDDDREEEDDEHPALTRRGRARA
jgi:lipid-binding SYLF domain-containing protein